MSDDAGQRGNCFSHCLRGAAIVYLFLSKYITSKIKSVGPVFITDLLSWGVSKGVCLRNHITIYNLRNNIIFFLGGGNTFFSGGNPPTRSPPEINTGRDSPHNLSPYKLRFTKYGYYYVGYRCFGGLTGVRRPGLVLGVPTP